jgi:putative transposase
MIIAGMSGDQEAPDGDTSRFDLYRTFGGRRSLRLPEYDYRQSCACHLTWGTYRRAPHLARESLARAVIDDLSEDALCMGMAVYAYCIMPDHVHLLVSSRGRASLVAFVQRFKSRSTRSFWSLGGRGRLWQRGFYDHVLRRSEEVERWAAYILGNPVRAGLVDDAAQYLFCGSFVWPDAIL